MRPGCSTVEERTDRAYVLGTSALGEADLIVTLLAERAGKVRGVARSARKSRRRFAGALDLLTRVDARWVERPGRELHRIVTLDPLASPARWMSDPRDQAAAAVVAEVCARFGQADQEAQRIVRLIGAILAALEGGADRWSLIRYFEYWTLRLHGVLPDWNHCQDCGRELSRARVVDRDGVVRCGDCAAGGVALPGSALERLARFASSPPAELTGEDHQLRPGGPLEALLRGTLQGFAERAFKSYRHLERAMKTPFLNGAIG